jgi:hypothetical protein
LQLVGRQTEIALNWFILVNLGLQPSGNNYIGDVNVDEALVFILTSTVRTAAVKNRASL